MSTVAAVFGLVGIVVICAGLIEAIAYHRPAWTLALVGAGGACSATCFVLGEIAARRRGLRPTKSRR